jgi:hypothetical protein
MILIFNHFFKKISRLWTFMAEYRKIAKKN